MLLFDRINYTPEIYFISVVLKRHLYSRTGEAPYRELLF